MKKNLNVEFLDGFSELSREESMSIIGGESLWYWIAYGVGYVGYVIKNSIDVQNGGQ